MPGSVCRTQSLPDRALPHGKHATLLAGEQLGDGAVLSRPEFSFAAAVLSPILVLFPLLKTRPLKWAPPQSTPSDAVSSSRVSRTLSGQMACGCVVTVMGPHMQRWGRWKCSLPALGRSL